MATASWLHLRLVMPPVAFLFPSANSLAPYETATTTKDHTINACTTPRNQRAPLHRTPLYAAFLSSQGPPTAVNRRGLLRVKSPQESCACSQPGHADSLSYFVCIEGERSFRNRFCGYYVDNTNPCVHSVAARWSGSLELFRNRFVCTARLSPRYFNDLQFLLDSQFYVQLPTCNLAPKCANKTCHRIH